MYIYIILIFDSFESMRTCIVKYVHIQKTALNLIQVFKIQNYNTNITPKHQITYSKTHIFIFQKYIFSQIIHSFESAFSA